MVASWSLDHVGPMARTVDGVARLLGFRASRCRATFRACGWASPAASFATMCSPRSPRPWTLPLACLAAAGAHLVDIELPDMTATPALGSLIALPELFALHRADLAHDVGPQVRLNLELGLVEPASAYVAALRARVPSSAPYARPSRRTPWMACSPRRFPSPLPPKTRPPWPKTRTCASASRSTWPAASAQCALRLRRPRVTDRLRKLSASRSPMPWSCHRPGLRAADRLARCSAAFLSEVGSAERGRRAADADSVGG